MAIFSSTKAVVEEALPEVGEIMGTMEASDQILYEAAEDVYKINAGLYISDILIEQAVTEGSANPDVLMEGTVKDFFKKIIDALKKFWAKVKAWFKAAIENIKVLFMNGEKFIKEYEGKLNDKKAKGFKYKAYKYSTDGETIRIKAVEKAKKASYITASGITDNASVEDVKGKLGDVAELENADFIESICKAGSGSANTLAELKDIIIKAAHSNSDEEMEWIDFNGNSKDLMIQTVKNYKKHLSEIENSESETYTTFANVIKSFESLEKNIKDNASLTSIIGKVSTNVKSALSCIQSLNALNLQIRKEQYNAFLHILKRYAVYKDKTATKESATTVEGSLLESAMALL